MLMVKIVDSKRISTTAVLLLSGTMNTRTVVVLFVCCVHDTFAKSIIRIPTLFTFESCTTFDGFIRQNYFCFVVFCSYFFFFLV